MYDSLISTDELDAELNNSEWLIIDCRFYLDNPPLGALQFNEFHIPGALYAHLDNDLSSRVYPGVTGRHPLPCVLDVSELFSQWGINSHTQVVVYDQGPGMIAARLWWMLRYLGHEKVALLDGGWKKWQDENRSKSSEAHARQASAFRATISSAMEANVDDVEACVANKRSCRLLDARMADRFRGENETIDPVAGHIPGAISAPFMNNLSSDGCFLSRQELRQKYSTILGSLSAENTIVYCGSGVSAAHDVLAMYYAGLGMSRLYVGSWSHWITDKNRPIATGGE